MAFSVSYADGPGGIGPGEYGDLIEAHLPIDPAKTGPFVSKLVAFKSKWVVAAVFLYMLTMANTFTHLKNDANPPFYRFWSQRAEIFKTIRRHYSGYGLIEVSDGIFSYSLPIPAMSGLGFNLDKLAYDAKKRGDFLKIAYERGFCVLAAMNNYLKIPESVQKDACSLRKYIRSAFFFHNEKLDQWVFEVVLQDEKYGVTLVRF